MNTSPIVMGALALSAALSLSSQAFGETTTTVTTTKSSPYINLSDFSGNLSIGHNNSTKFDPVETDKISGTDVSLTTSLTLGLRTLGGKVNYSLNSSYSMVDGSTYMKTNQPYAVVSVNAWSSESYGSLTLFGVYNIEFNDNQASGSPGLTYSAPGFALGKVKFSPSLTLKTTIYGDKKLVDAVVLEKPGFGEDEETVKVAQTDFDYNGSARLGASYAVEAISGLSIGSSISYGESYKPKYTLATRNSAAEVNYESSASSSASVSLSYGLTDKMRLSSGLTYRAKDFFGEPRTGSSSRFVNSTVLSITLF